MAVGFGIVGCGMISNFHARAIEEIRGAKFVACFDNRLESAERLASEFGGVAYSDLNAMLADPKVDVVTICTPSGAHMEPAVAAANAGKHVHIQKPMANDVASAMRIVEACERNGVMLKLAENYVHYPPLTTAKELIDNGMIGTISQMRMKFVGAGSGGWDVPKESWKWRESESESGRPDKTFDHGHHMFATAYWFLNKHLPTHVFGHVAPNSPDTPSVCMFRCSTEDETTLTGMCVYHRIVLENKSHTTTIQVL